MIRSNDAQTARMTIYQPGWHGFARWRFGIGITGDARVELAAGWVWRGRRGFEEWNIAARDLVHVTETPQNANSPASRSRRGRYTEPRKTLRNHPT